MMIRSISVTLILIATIYPAQASPNSPPRSQISVDYQTRSSRLNTFISNFKRQSNNKENVLCQKSAQASALNFYVEARYSDAYRAFSDSFTLLPAPDTFILLADTALRIVIQDVDDSNLFKQKGNVCWKAHAFASRARRILIDEYEMALDLRDTLKLDPRDTTGIFARATQTSACLDGLINEYEQAPENTCVDISLLKQCVGKPLISGPKRTVPSC